MGGDAAGEDGEAEGPPPPAWVEVAEGHSDHVLCLSLHSRRAELAASGGKDSVVYLWDVAQGQALRRTELPVNPTDVVFGRGASDHLLLTALDSTNAGMRGVVAAWDIEAGTRHYEIDAWQGHISCLGFSKTGDTFLVGAADGTVRQHASATGELIFSFASGMSDVNMVSLSASELYVQASGDRDQTYVLDRRRPDRPLHVLGHDAPISLEFVNGVSAQWCHLAASTLVTGSDDGLVRIWDVSLGEPLVATLRGHSSPVSCVGVAPGDDLIASGGDEGKVVLYSSGGVKRGEVPLRLGAEQDNFLRY